MNGELVAHARQIQKKFSETWTLDTRDLVRPAAEKVLEDLIAQAPFEMSQRLRGEFFQLGPLEALTADESVTEIIVNGSREIWYESAGRFLRHPDSFLTPSTFKNTVERICSEAGATVNLAEPFADGRWRNFRMHLVSAPLADREFHLTLRRISAVPWTLARLQECGWADSKSMDRLKELVATRKNIIFIGATGSGKTSVLGAALKAIPADERAVIIEDTDELPVPNAASTKLLTRCSSASALREVTLAELVKQSLRMRPHRLVVGEVRGGEAKDLLLALATGHTGSLGTLHATDPRQALLRLEMLVQMGAPQWSTQAIRQLIHLSVDHIVLCGNANGHRRLEGLYKVAALESFGFLLEQIF